jgi:hypothetical protein
MIHHAGMWILPPTPHTGHHFVAPTSEIFMLRPRIHERPDKKSFGETFGAATGVSDPRLQ